MKSHNPWHNEHGAVLVTSLIFIAILAVVGTSAYMTSSNELKISSNYRAARQAFYDADAGVNYAIARIEDDLTNGTLTLTIDEETVNYPAPTGFSFDTITTLTKQTGTNNYSFQSTGHSGNARCTIEVLFVRDPALEFGVFGEEEVDLKQNGHVYSYDSSETPNPTPGDSTGEGDVGSNEEVIVHNNTQIDGNVGLGEDGAGTEAVFTQTGIPDIAGDVVDVDRVDIDPLGAIGGSLANDFVTYSTSNDNAQAVPAIVGNVIDLGNGESMTLGKGDYYLTEINLHAGATLEIDASAGPVNIYLHGPLDAKNGSAINLNGNPPDFTIYCDTTDSFVFKHGSLFKGSIYAPYGHIEMKNSSDVYGMLWGNTVGIKNTGEFFFDSALLEKWPSDTVSIVSWREVRG